METMEHIAFTIIASAGDAQTAMLEALAAARKGDFSQAESQMKGAEKLLLKAHRIQTDLIKQEADGAKLEYSFVLVHAQDHLMNAMLSKKLIQEMIYLYQEIKEKK